MRPILVLLLASAAACGPAEPPARLPFGPTQGFVSREPVVVVGQAAAGFFSAPQAGQPAAAARAVAEMEWLAATVPTHPIWQTASGLASVGLLQARNEARTALGIPPRAPAQAVINGLAAAAIAIEDGDSRALDAALPRATFPLGPAATVQRLAQPPAVPSAMLALAALSRGPAPRPRSR